MIVLLRTLLAFAGAISLLGAVWFFGSAGSYPGIVAGLAMLGWALLWHPQKTWAQVLVSALVLSAIVATVWMVIARLMSDPAAATVALFVALTAVFCAAAWLRQQFWR